MVALVCIMLHCELTAGSRSIYHLRIIIVPLSIDLVAEILLVDVALLIASSLTWYNIYHIWSCCNLGVIPTFKWFQLIVICSRSNNGLLRICRTYIVILVSFSTCDPISCVSIIYILILGLDCACGDSRLVLICWSNCSIGRTIFVIDNSIIIEWYMYSSISTTYILNLTLINFKKNKF